LNDVDGEELISTEEALEKSSLIYDLIYSLVLDYLLSQIGTAHGIIFDPIRIVKAPRIHIAECESILGLVVGHFLIAWILLPQQYLAFKGFIQNVTTVDIHLVVSYELDGSNDEEGRAN
jgi:hypothetical protein